MSFSVVFATLLVFVSFVVNAIKDENGLHHRRQALAGGIRNAEGPDVVKKVSVKN